MLRRRAPWSMALSGGAGGGTVTPHFVFAAMPGHTRGGSRDLVGAYPSEDAARAAFHDLRRRVAADGAWAEVVAVQPSGRLRRVCWFGPGAAPGHFTKAAGGGSDGRPRLALRVATLTRRRERTNAASEPAR